jgi:hypothetical protein
VVLRGATLAGALALTLVAASARADDTHYRAVPLGAYAIAPGGAFAGVADDASAAVFNPAGLALGGNVGLAGGLTINAWERLELRRAFEQEDRIIDATTRRARTVPIFVGAAIKLGRKDSEGQKRFTLAVSVLEPIFSSGGVFLRSEADPLSLSDTYSVNENDRATWYGASVAYRFGSKHSIRLGWLYRIQPKLQLGLMVQPPGIPLKQTVNTLSQGFVTDNRDPTMPTTTQAYFVDEKQDAHLPLAAEIEAGLQYRPTEKVMFRFTLPCGRGNASRSPAPSELEACSSTPTPSDWRLAMSRSAVTSRSAKESCWRPVSSRTSRPRRGFRKTQTATTTPASIVLAGRFRCV